MSVRSVLGMDWFDLGLQATVTGVILFWIGATNNPHDATVMAAATTTASLVLLGIRRHFGLRRAATRGLTTGEVALDSLHELEQRVAELELDRARVAELEERLDFAERLLASHSTAERPKELAR